MIRLLSLRLISSVSCLLNCLEGREMGRDVMSETFVFYQRTLKEKGDEEK